MKYGLDFGTSNSTISFYDGKNITLLPVEKNTGTPEIMQQFMSFLKEVKRSTSDPDKIKCLEELVYEKLGLDIFMAIESAKIALSKDQAATVEYGQGSIDIQELVKRFEFEQFIESYANEISAMIEESLSQVELDCEEMDVVVMVGGSSRIPMLKRIVEEKFPAIPVTKTDIYSSVAYGLSVAD